MLYALGSGSAAGCDGPRQRRQRRTKRKASARPKPGQDDKGGAPKGNTNALGNPDGGRPSDYKPEYAAIAKKMCALGATVADLADAFGVAISTIWSWQAASTEFFESCKIGRDLPNERVKRSFYAALGSKCTKLLMA